METSNVIDQRKIIDLSGMQFCIPNYQRGYRWSKQQVLDLLSDLENYIEENQQKNLADKGCYCLQPVVVRPISGEDTKKYGIDANDKQCFEVLDGQQRLTTIHILITYLENTLLYGNSISTRSSFTPYDIYYETRKQTTTTLKQPNVFSATDIDSYHISMAYHYMDQWFNNDFNKQNAFFKLVTDPKSLESVQLIWYEIHDVNTSSIELFTRINIGKIPLTNAELVKALFLQSSNFEQLQTLRRFEIANEWDRIEAKLQDGDFWYFLNGKKKPTPARIDCLFSFIADILRKEDIQQFSTKYGDDEYTTFRVFYEKFHSQNASVDQFWENVTSYFHVFEEWYNNTIYYHYIGYLRWCGVDLCEIYNDAHQSEKSKFLSKLEDRIRDTIKNVKITDSNRIELYYQDEKGSTAGQKGIRKVLLLFNLLTLTTDPSKTYIRFPFKLFVEEDWDIEHIDSYTTNPLKDKESQNEWLKEALEENPEELESLKEEIIKFQKTGEARKFEVIRLKVAQAVGELTANIDTNEKNNIQNLTLLNASINREYGNALFRHKREKILENDKKGIFIPICTKNVFLHLYDAKNGSFTTQWGEDNFKPYSLAIISQLKGFWAKTKISQELEQEPENEYIDNNLEEDEPEI